jgi:hypothetical protein
VDLITTRGFLLFEGPEKNLGAFLG